MTRCKTILGSFLATVALVGCGSSREPVSLAARNKAACEAWIDHIIGLPCVEPDPDGLSDVDREGTCEALPGGQAAFALAGCDATDFYECLIGQYSCIGDSLAIGGAVMDDTSGFAGFVFFFLPFETCMPELDDSPCWLFDQGAPCHEIPTTVEGKEWSLTTADPRAMFPAMTDDVEVSISGVGHEVTSAWLFTPITQTDEGCDSSAPDLTLFFDSQSLSVNGSIAGVSEDCELNFEGEVTDCVEPSGEVTRCDIEPSGEVTDCVEDEHTLRFEGQGTYRSADGTGVLSTMFLHLSERSNRPEL
jgi:hypothetical protein